MSAPPTLEIVLAAAASACDDLELALVARWKEETGGKAIGFLPVYVPREVVHAAGALPVALFGGGDRVEVIRGDACFQSYICRLPRSSVECQVSGRWGALDGFLFPSTCDVIRNLSGVWQLLAPERWVRYVDLPQGDDRAAAARFYRGQLETVAREVAALAGRGFEPAALARSIALYNRNREAVERLQELRRAAPGLAPASEAYRVLRAGAVLPVEEHTTLVDAYVAAARASGRRALDRSRVVVAGAFCEQPPLALLRTLERAGCDVVADDLLLGLKWLERGVAEEGDPLDAVVEAYLDASVASPIRWIGKHGEKGRALVEQVRRSGAEGVVFCAPSFCDPALLDQPMLAAALARAGIPHASFKYAEDTGQFAVIREQAGTFADSIRLWTEAGT